MARAPLLVLDLHTNLALSTPPIEVQAMHSGGLTCQSQADLLGSCCCLNLAAVHPEPAAWHASEVVQHPVAHWLHTGCAEPLRGPCHPCPAAQRDRDLHLLLLL
jgi:hypothetical protein